jgi:hypothetical protein
MSAMHAPAPAHAKPHHQAVPHVRIVGHWPQQTLSGRQAITIRLSSAVSSADTPKLTAGVKGTWALKGARTLRFVPAGTWAPYSTVSVTAASTPHVKVTGTATFSVQARPAHGALTKALIALKFLPVHLTDQQKFVVNPGWPSQLSAIWSTDRPEMLKGAVMAFQSQHGLDMDGAAGADTWPALTAALTHHTDNTAGYTYALGDQTEPETLTVWHDAKEVLHAPANTGIAASPTEPGTFAVYERLQSQIMRGTNPDGSSYADPVSWVAYFNGGDAVHYIARADYGVPQSLGCIETSYSDAETAWHYLSYGSLVTVTPEG